jgi:alpha-galactosidase
MAAAARGRSLKLIKVAMIGAGSVVFSKNLTGDILGFPEFKDATFSYMDIDAERLEVGADLCRKVGKALGANPTIEATQDRRKALEGADFVINMVQIGGFDSTLVDFEIPRKYGLGFTIADTTGPGGFFRALRTYPMLKGLVEDMMAVCPDATLLNYSNPMSMNMQTITRSSNIKAVGLCHSIQGTLNQLMGYLGEKPGEINFICAGINHMAFYTRLQKGTEDLYPRLFAAMDDAKVYNTNKVRFELMRRLGYFITESSEHNAEYNPWFIPHGAAKIKEFDVPMDEYLRRCDGIVDEFERMKVFSKSDDPITVHRSHEYGSTIIHSIVTGTPSVVYGNMPNRGAISNLPYDAIAEAPTLVDRAGLQFTTVGALPPQLIGYMMPHVTQHELFIRAAQEGRRDHIYQAAMFDPLTAATMPTDKIVEMCDELIVAHGDFLPNVDAKKTLIPTSGKRFDPPTPKELRASWDAAQKEGHQDDLSEWKLLGPFHNTEKAISTGWVPNDISEAVLTSGEHTDGWKTVEADKRGMVNLGRELGRHDYSIAYAYTEIESIHAREAVLKCGSDDGIKIWLNGKVILDVDKARNYTEKEDSAVIYLAEGTNKLLVKITNHIHGWSFGVSIPKPNF